MNKINPALLHNFKAALLGRLKLSIFKTVSGAENVIPTPGKLISYFEKRYKDNPIVLDLSNYILTNARYAVLDYSDLDKEFNINQVFKELDENPISQPMFYEVNGYLENQPIGVYIKCHQLAGLEGHFYEIATLVEGEFIGGVTLCEIRTSQRFPEPAFSYFSVEGKPLTSGKDDTDWASDFTLRIAMQVMNYVSNFYLDYFVSMKKGVEKDKKGQLKFRTLGPEDPKYITLIQQLYREEIQCHIAFVKPELITPYSFDACFMIPFYEINEARRLLRDFKNQGVVVYWRDGYFVLSDDYLTYMALRISGAAEIKVVILGRDGTENVKIHLSGGFNLLPPIKNFKPPQMDAFTLDMQQLLLDEYITKLTAINNLKSLVSSKCVVLSEDKHTDMLQVLLMANGFDTEGITIMSYDNCTKLDLLPLTLGTIRKIKSDIIFIIHRDSDYLAINEIDKVKDKIMALGANPFITQGTDIESYFLNAAHINYLYPNLSIEHISEWITDSTLKTKELSVEKMMKHKYGEKYREYLSEKHEFISIYNQAPDRYRIGKETMKILKSVIHPHVEGNVSLIEPSPFLKTPVLEEIGSALWPY